jgi:hypothetical protein
MLLSNNLWFVFMLLTVPDGITAIAPRQLDSPNTNACSTLVEGANQHGQGAGQSGPTIKFVGTADSVGSCAAAAAAWTSASESHLQCQSACWFRAPSNASFLHQCYCHVDPAWMPFPTAEVDSARLVWPCATARDCSYNGQCRTSDGTCQCQAAWKGSRCGELNLLPAAHPHPGYKRSDSGGNVSSWGAPVLWDEHSGRWHGWASEMVDNCGINAWETNSQVASGVWCLMSGVWCLVSGRPARRFCSA